MIDWHKQKKLEQESNISVVRIIAVIFTVVLLPVIIVSGGMCAHKVAMTQSTEEKLSLIHNACEMYKSDCGQYPDSLDSLSDEYIDSSIQYPLCDMWRKPFHYETTEDTVHVFSAGPDMMYGTPDDIIYEKKDKEK